MPALRTVLRTPIGSVSPVLLFLLNTLFATALFSQTSVNEVHIVPRIKEPVSSAASSLKLVGGSLLHVIKSDVRLVLVPVSVTDGMQRFVKGLHKENFQVFEGKAPQEIREFSSEDVPVSIGIILDMSGSMGDKLTRVREAIHQFCDTANLQDEFFLIDFSDMPHLAVDFTTSPEEIEKELVFSHPKGRTALLDAIYLGLRKMKSARYQKKALLIVSDGGDNHSLYDEREVRSVARESDVLIYSIGIFDRYVPTVEELRGPTLLSDIAEPTGGRAYVLQSPNEIPAVARHIGAELRTQYVLAYKPENLPVDGKWRKINVKLRLPKKLSYLQAHFRTGYFAPGE